MWTHIDTFSGIGGFALAAAWTQAIETVQFVEIDPWCRRVTGKHWPGVAHERSIKTFVGYGRVDLLTGGFPCQPWSAAGKQLGVDDHRDLWPELARTIRVIRPRWCLFENVSGIVNMEGGLTRVLTDLGEAGYEAQAFVIPAAAVGAYHRRDRVWIVAHAAEQPTGEPHNEAHAIAISGQAWPLSGLRGDGTADVAHAADGGLRRGSAPGATGLVAQRGQDAADAAAPRLQERDGLRPRREVPNAATATPLRRETLSRLGDAPDGLSRWVVGRPTFGPDWEAGIPRVTEGEEDRVNKLKALGNSIVPQVAYELMVMMLAADKEGSW